VIVRVLGEGQYRVDDALVDRLNEIDAEAVRAVESGDEQALRDRLAQLFRLVVDEGARLDDAHLGASDLIVPPPDLDLDEARELFRGEGLIPDLPGSR
jgi:hypothetical protein